MKNELFYIKQNLDKTKYTHRFKSVPKFHDAGSIVTVGFALSKGPNFHRAHKVTIRTQMSITVLDL